jgi:phosphoenolpyruvate carboxylase
MEFIRETKNIIENADKILYEYNKKYYRDVLDFLNLLFSSSSKSILSIYINKIAISRDILEIYNIIVKKYKLEIELFNIDLFFDEDPILNSDIYSRNDIISICQHLCDNLLLKVSYKTEILYFNGKSTIKIKSI